MTILNRGAHIYYSDGMQVYLWGADEPCIHSHTATGAAAAEAARLCYFDIT